MSRTENDDQELTRKQRRESARADRKAAEQSLAASAARRRRMTQLGGAIAVVVVAIVVILIATGGASKKQAPTPESSSGKGALATVTKEIGGIPQSANTLGSPTAPVTMQYFGDLECPFCGEFTVSALPEVVAKWVRTGKLKIEYRSLETATHEPEAFRTQQVAAMAAGKQNKEWWYLELFYHQQGEENSGYVTEAFLQGLAQQVPGLNLSKWSSDRGDQALQTQLASDTQEANNVGFTGTPSFLLGRSGSTLKKLEQSEYGSFNNAAGFNSAIEKLVKT